MIKLYQIFFLIVIINKVLFSQFNYPETPQITHIDTIHGNILIDNYKRLENDKDSTVVKWFQDQMNFTEGILSKFNQREKIATEISEIDKLIGDDIHKIKFINERYFYLKTSANDETAKLFSRDGIDGEEKLMFDPAAFTSTEGKFWEISDYSPSWDANKIVISVPHDGTEHNILLIYDIPTRKMLFEKIDKASSYVYWLRDNSSFIYTRFPFYPWEDDLFWKNSKSYIHILGHNVETDKLIFDRINYPELELLDIDIPKINIAFPESENIFLVHQLALNQFNIWIAPLFDLKKEKINFKKIADKDDGIISFIPDESGIYFLSDKNNPSYEIRFSSIENPQFEKSEIIASTEDEVIVDFTVTKENLVYTQSRGVESKLFVTPLKDNSKTKVVPLPVSAYIPGITESLIKSSKVFVPLNSWIRPKELWTLRDGSLTLEKNELVKQIDIPIADELVIEEIYIPSHDGAMVPLSIIYHKDIKKDGSNPLWMWGYGCYGFSEYPYFASETLVKSKYGIINVIAHVRGGGELGKAWYEAGKMKNKSNTWKDFIACAEYLIEAGFTSKNKIIIEGASAGGITIGRSITERPDLFAVAIIEVPILDQMSTAIKLGPMNSREFGLISDPDNYDHLLEMSAYRKIEKGINYPAQLIIGGWNDPRVPSFQPGKFAALMQEYNASDKPVLLRIDFGGGHGFGSTSSYNNYLADKFLFAMWQIGDPEFQP